MKTLSEVQITYIQKDLKSKKTSTGFHPEILDHLCCKVEKLINKGLDFESAYSTALKDFSTQDFIELSSTSEMVKKKRRIVSTQLIGALLAASILIFIFGVDAQTPPDSNPIPNALIAASFGFRLDPLSRSKQHHRGIDLKCEAGTPIFASGDGRVVFAGVEEFDYGNKIVIQHDKHFQTIYAHLSEITVSSGQEIKKGDVIGLVGQTGRATGPHLHYEVIKDGVAVDPLEYFSTHSE